MGKKRNRDKVHVKVTDMATDECNSVYDIATSLPCTLSKSPPGKKGKVKMNIDVQQVHFFQETHSCDSDSNFWKTQWGDYVIFSHRSNHSAGVAIFFNKFKGNVLETIRSDNGRWVILTVKLDNSTLIICNVYGFNVRAHNLEMFKEICDTITRLKKKYKDGYVIIGGDFNDAPDDSVDHFPPKHISSRISDLFDFITDKLQVSDIWRYLNPNFSDYTWNNRSLSLKSRIDYWLIPHDLIHYVSEIKITCAPPSDHKLISISFDGCKGSTIRGYWKFNNSLLSGSCFVEQVKLLPNIFENNNLNYTQKWELFKFNVRVIAMRRGKELKTN